MYNIILHNIKLPDSQLQYVAILALTNKGWIWVMNKDRNTWELPGGHIEQNESVTEAAKRELYEETGSIEYSFTELFDYTIVSDIAKSFGRMFFAKIKVIGPLPESEIGQIDFFKNQPKELTYPMVQNILFDKTITFLKNKNII